MPFEIIPPGTHIDFIGKQRIAAFISIALIVASLAAVATRGVKLGIDFAGGTEFQVRFTEAAPASEAPLRGIVAACGVPGATVVRYGGGGEEYLIRFQEPPAEALAAGFENEGCELSAEERGELERVAAAAGGADLTGLIVQRLAFAIGHGIGPIEVERVEFVGPRVGDELRRDGISSLTIASLLILAYVAFRFSARFAPGAIVALVHDIGITAGLFVIFGIEFDLRVLAALLAILGYSLNDTIIIYDRIRENMELRTKYDLKDVLNRSVNQTLSRTVLTSGTTMAAVLALLILGGEVIRPFALAMSVGIVVGTYSSVFIAAPTLLWLETRFGGDAAAESAKAAPRAEHPKSSPKSKPSKPSKPPKPRKRNRA